MEASLNIDWHSPWFAPWRGTGEQVLQSWRTRPLHEALGSAGAFRFVPHRELALAEPYESFIFRTRTIPTRENAHDFFNGLAWLRFAQLKQRLNEMQARQIAADGIGARRGPVRDAITLLDESGAFIEAPQALWQALRAREWKRLFIELRPLWNEARVTIFGHAMLEQLLSPRKDITAHVWCGADFTAEVLAAKPFLPLPVMGIPGWHRESENFSFYDDSNVFRPLRSVNRG